MSYDEEEELTEERGFRITDDGGDGDDLLDEPLAPLEGEFGYEGEEDPEDKFH